MRWLVFTVTLASATFACATPAILTPGGTPVDPCGEYGVGHKCSDGACCPLEGDVCGGPRDEPSCPEHSCCAAAGPGDWPLGKNRKPTMDQIPPSP